jgi:hypothetical protein
MKERFFMRFENPAVDLLWSQPLHSDCSRAPLRQVRKDKEPLRNATEDDSQALNGPAIGLGRTKIRH